MLAQITKSTTRKVSQITSYQSRSFTNNSPQATLNQIYDGDLDLPKLPYAYQDLEPAISARIMELHHSRHHQNYINAAAAIRSKAIEAGGTKQGGNTTKSDFVLTQNLIKSFRFNVGGHINHGLFWKNLAPEDREGGKLENGTEILKAIRDTFGSYENMQSQMKLDLYIWGWIRLDYNRKLEVLEINFCDGQNYTVPHCTPLLLIDVWEHAFYLQYENKINHYLDNIWRVINWKTVEERYVNALKVKIKC